MHENPGQRLRHDGENGPIGVRMQPFQGWENVGAQTQGSARRATQG